MEFPRFLEDAETAEEKLFARDRLIRNSQRLKTEELVRDNAQVVREMIDAGQQEQRKLEKEINDRVSKVTQ